MAAHYLPYPSMTKKLILVLGVILLAVGVLGFWNNPVLGLFAVDTLHNIVHIATGLIAIAFAMKGEASARTFARIFGVIYAITAIAGFTLSTDGKILGILTADANDHILHLLLALVFLALGFRKNSSSAPIMTPPMGGSSLGM